MSRSKGLHEAPKRKRVQEHQKMAASVGHTSSSPGAWLTNTIIDSLIPVPDPLLNPEADEFTGADLSAWHREQYISARIILDSYRFSPRYRTVCIPLQPDLLKDGLDFRSPTFHVLEPELETRSFCNVKVQSDPEQLALEQAPSFKMLEQEYVLSGSALRSWRAARYAEADLEEYAKYFDNEQPEQKEEKVKKVTSTSRLIRVSSAQLNAEYANWADRRGDEDRARFLEILHHFLCRKTSLAVKGDSLRDAELSDDFQQDFLLRMLDVLATGLVSCKRLDNPAAYINQAWKNERNKGLSRLSAQRKKELSPDIFGLFADDSDIEMTHIDVEDHAQWSLGSRVSPISEKSEEEVRRERLAKLDSLPPATRDLVGMQLQGKKQREIAEVLKISQQAVSVKLLAVREILQAAPEATT